MSKLLIVSHDYIGERMAGVGIRYFEIAKALAASPEIGVTLAAPSPGYLPGCSSVRFVTYERGCAQQLAGELRATDAVLCYPGTLCDLSSILPESLPVTATPISVCWGAATSSSAPQSASAIGGWAVWMPPAASTWPTIALTQAFGTWWMWCRMASPTRRRSLFAP